MQFSTYVPPEKPEGDTFKPSENLDHLLILKVTDHKHIESTAYKAQGGPGIIADVCDLDQDGAVFRDILFMSEVLVEKLRGYVDKTMCIRFVGRPSKVAGRRDWIDVEPAAEKDVARAQAHVDKGDPFAVQLATVAPVSAAPPF